MIKKAYQKEIITLDGRRQHAKLSQLKFRNLTTLGLNQMLVQPDKQEWCSSKATNNLM